MQRPLPFPSPTAGLLLAAGIECDRAWSRAFLTIARKQREAGDRRVAAWALTAAAQHTRRALQEARR